MRASSGFIFSKIVLLMCVCLTQLNDLTGIAGCGNGFIATGAGPNPAPGGGGGGRPGAPGGPGGSGGGPAGPGGPKPGGPGGGGGGMGATPAGPGGAGGPGGGGPGRGGEPTVAEPIKAAAIFGPSPEFLISSFASSGRFAKI